MVAGGPAEGESPGRAMLTIAGWNALSRLTGFGRVLAVGGALGTTYLGNTYQGANLVSNLLFELLAAGLLSAPLVPAFVRLMAGPGGVERPATAPEARAGDDAAGALAGNLLGIALAVLGAVVLVAALVGDRIMGLLVSGVEDAGTRAAQVRLGRFLLWFFLPQVLFYATGAIATALLQARRRFAAAAAAPVANNLAVIATMALIGAGRGGQPPSLDLSSGDRLLLGLGTTLGVVAMTAVPVVAARRAGLHLRLRIEPGDPALRAVARVGAWGGLLLAGAQVLIAVTLVLANRVPGGVVAYQIAFTCFLLPFALIAHPVFTALYPRLAAAAHLGRWDVFGTDVRDGLTRLAALLIPASGLLIALAQPGLRTIQLGALDARGTRLVATVLVPYAAGLVSYGAFHLLARAWTALGAPAVPAVVGLGSSVVGALAMWALAASGRGDARVIRLGWAHSAAMAAAVVVLLVLLRRRVGVPVLDGWAVVIGGLAGLAGWTAATLAVRAADGFGRGAAARATVLGGLAGMAASGLVLLAGRKRARLVPG